jgi:hypothetical protein
MLSLFSVCRYRIELSVEAASPTAPARLALLMMLPLRPARWLCTSSTPISASTAELPPPTRRS